MEANLIEAEVHSGLGGGGFDAGLKTSVTGEAKVASVPVGVNVEVGASGREGPYAKGSAQAGPAGVEVKANKEGVTVSPAKDKGKDTKLGGKLKAGVGVGVSLNLTQAARALSKTIDAAKAVGEFVAGISSSVVPSFHPPRAARSVRGLPRRTP